jgi:hypothetical protein
VQTRCQYVSSWFQNQINTVSYAGYTLCARLGYRYKQVEFLQHHEQPINCMLPMSLEEIPIDQATLYRTAFSWWDCGTTYH